MAQTLTADPAEPAAPAQQRVIKVRRDYNAWVASETLEDYALRFTPRSFRKWSEWRVANTALGGAASFLVLEALGATLLLQFGFINAFWAILATAIIIIAAGLPISVYAARHGLDMDLLTRGAGFGYIGSTVTSLIYALSLIHIYAVADGLAATELDFFAIAAGLERVVLLDLDDQARVGQAHAVADLSLIHIFYSDDMADACVFLMNLPDDRYTALLGSDESRSGRFEPPLINIGVGEDQTIAELAALIAHVVGFTGRIAYDASQPDGTPRKLMDVSHLRSAGWQARTPLEQGLRAAYAEFAATQGT